MQPSAKLRQAQKLLRLAERYGIPRLEQACAYALSFELTNVRRLEHILEHALDQPVASVVASASSPHALPPSSRFARPGNAFDHLFAVAAGGA